MKKNLPLLYFISGFFLSAISGCAKPGIKQAVTVDKAAGSWVIHDIRLKIFYGGTLAKDSLVPWKPVRRNYINFDGISKVDYCYNAADTKEGTYNLMGDDSIHVKLADDNRQWKILLLTSTNFSIESTTTDNNEFPGATVITYKGFIR